MCVCLCVCVRVSVCVSIKATVNNWGFTDGYVRVGWGCACMKGWSVLSNDDKVLLQTFLTTFDLSSEKQKKKKKKKKKNNPVHQADLSNPKHTACLQPLDTWLLSDLGGLQDPGPANSRGSFHIRPGLENKCQLGICRRTRAREGTCLCHASSKSSSPVKTDQKALAERHVLTKPGKEWNF